MKASLIIGITGQDGSYLSELLLSKNYIVYGMVRYSSSVNTSRITHLLENNNLRLRYGELSDNTNICKILNEIKNIPDLERIEIYNLGAMSNVKVSFSVSEYSSNINGLGVLRILESIILLGIKDITRFYQASTSELYGKVYETPQNEETPFYPRSPYGVAKLYGYWITKNYREAYSLFACNGILFNHESPRRSNEFVTKKITNGLDSIVSGKSSSLVLGNLDAKRDWGHAKEYVYGMWLMLQYSVPDDYILATNKYHTVREFVEKAFLLRGFDIRWKGSGLNEVGYCSKTNKELIFVSEEYFRPTEVEQLLGDATKAKTELGWETNISFDELVNEMVFNNT